MDVWVLLLHFLCIYSGTTTATAQILEENGEGEDGTLTLTKVVSKLLKLEEENLRLATEVINLKEDNLRLAALEIEVINLKEDNLYMRTKGFRTCRELKTNSDIKTSVEYFL